jgi:hypothetical protein
MVSPIEYLIHVTPNLRVTKEIMSRGPSVLDMEYWEPYDLRLALKDNAVTTGHHAKTMSPSYSLEKKKK